MSLYASFSEDANGVFSTVAGKIKDSGDGLWSPVYGAGEGNIRPSRTPAGAAVAVFDP